MSKKDISYFPWHLFANSANIDKELLLEHNVSSNSSWMLPQLMAFVNNNFILAKNETGKYSFLETVKATGKNVEKLKFSDGKPVEDKAILTGIVNMLKYAPRGDILPKMWKQVEEGSRYSTAVPLILSALKEYRNVQYSQWDWTEPAEYRKYLVEAPIVEASEYFGWECPFSTEELIEFRQIGRTIKSGSNLGSVKTIKATTAITGVTDPEFKKLPSLVKLMLCQTWIYHPTFRHELAITNLADIDTPAPSLIPTEVVPSSKSNNSNGLGSDIPW